MSSVDITSTNDVTSTAADSETSGSFAMDAAHHSHRVHTLTTDAIIRECIKQGFYRNPICNEKLYLHNRGFDSIAPTAFEPYTDVKVLWLEGNGFSSLPCGAGYTQVRPPVRVDPFAEATEEEEEEKAEEEGKTLDERGGSNNSAASSTAKATAAPAAHHTDPNAMTEAKTKTKAAPLPLPAEVPPEERDAFSSLYPTVRQLYLHNNLFRQMPDLSRFERVDSLNLSGNFFSTLDPHCPHWRRKQEMAAHKNQGGEGTSDNSAASCAVPAGEAASTAPAALALVPSGEAAKAQRAAQLEQCGRTAEAYALLCEHCPLPEREGEAPVLDAHGRPEVSAPYIPRQPPRPDPEYRNLCSSLRSLNVAGNRLESFEDCLGLLAFKALAVLDLSHNNILDGEALLFILERLPRLQSLKLSGNPLVRTLPRYRKRLLSRCKHLVYLDDRPVFPEERRLVTAWARAGEDGEEKERALIQQEKVAAEKKRLDDFRRLIARHHREGPDAPHAAYVSAITTSAALSAAADTGSAGGQGQGAQARPLPRRRRHRTATELRRPSSDPDNSPTSSDSSEEDGEEEQTAAAAAATEAASAEREADRIVPVHQENTNKPSTERAAAGGPTRVLSSNQRVRETAPTDSRRGEAGEDEDEGDIFVPGS